MSYRDAIMEQLRVRIEVVLVTKYFIGYVSNIYICSVVFTLLYIALWKHFPRSVAGRQWPGPVCYIKVLCILYCTLCKDPGPCSQNLVITCGSTDTVQ